MTAVLKIKIEELTLDWLEQLKSDYDGAEIELHIKEEQAPVLSEEEFWSIISLLDWEAEDNSSIIEPAVKELSAFSIAQIYAFQEQLAQKIYQLDTLVHAQHIGKAAYSNERHFSVDNFLYARACVVAHGKAIFEEVLENPHEMPKDLTFEPLLRLASDAYERKTKLKFLYLPSVSIETYSNQAAWSAAA